MNEIAPENLLCFCHSRPLQQCPTLNPGANSAPAPSATEEKPSMAPKKDQVHRRQFQMEVRIGLDPNERDPIVKKLTTALSDTDELKKEAANVAATYRKKLKDLKATVDELALTLSQGVPEMRLVEETRNFKTNILTIKEVDGGRQIEKRQMTDDDAQIPISDLPNAEEEHDQT